jgi:DNA-binding transcriptional MerR regulator
MPKSINPRKIRKILGILRKYPDGIWFRQLAKEARLPVSTLHFYLEKVLEPFIENIGFRDEEGRFVGIRVIRLRDNGVTEEKILRYIELNKKIRKES